METALNRESARAFAESWAGRGNENQDTQVFWIDLLQNVLGLDDATSRLSFEVPVHTEASNHEGYIDVLIPSASTIVEQKSAGIDLAKPETRQGRQVTPVQQALAYTRGLPLSERPRYIVACNFQEFWVYDQEQDPLCGEPVYRLPLSDLPENLAALQFLRGDGEPPEVLAEAVSVQAGKIIGNLHDLAAASFPDPDAPENHHALSVLMTRLMFLMFCEDAGLVPPSAFRNYVEHYAPEDLRDALKKLFRWLNTPDAERRPEYESDLIRRLPYMNGGLFAEEAEVPQLSEEFKHVLVVEGCDGFDWSEVSPTVFGSIFEGALSHDRRRANGQFFTTPANIHRVIDPLFLDGLRAEFRAAAAKPVAGGARTKALAEFHDKLAGITVLDPACGSGNFLTESYLCLRRLENQVLLELMKADRSAPGQQFASFEELGEKDVLVSLSSFHGIEIEDFACCVARAALWIAEKQADAETAKVTSRVYAPLPLVDYGTIVQGDALALDWSTVVGADECDYVIGNPPFLGSSRCSKEQKAAVVGLYGKIKLSNSLDYVAGWYYRACDYMQGNPAICTALVSTNSITQGEQVYPIWRTLQERFGVGIDFAWKTFWWSTEADDPARVHCVIVGFSVAGDHAPAVLYDPAGGAPQELPRLSPYLRDLPPEVLVQSRKRPLNAPAKAAMGNKPADDGNFILSDAEKDRLFAKDPGMSDFVRRYVGAKDFLNGSTRWCLWLLGVPAGELLKHPLVLERVKRVHDFRAASSAKDTRKRADAAQEFFRTPVHDTSYLAMPETSSERRRYIPFGFLDADTIPSNALTVLPEATPYMFGVLSSRVHNAWVRAVAGRLKSDLRYTPALVYNNFPWPESAPEQRERIEACAQNALDARASYDGVTLADLYDPDKAFLFPKLVSAHEDLDRAVEDAYGFAPGTDEDTIVARLFELYAQLADDEG